MLKNLAVQGKRKKHDQFFEPDDAKLGQNGKKHGQNAAAICEKGSKCDKLQRNTSHQLSKHNKNSTNSFDLKAHTPIAASGKRRGKQQKCGMKDTKKDRKNRKSRQQLAEKDRNL